MALILASQSPRRCQLLAQLGYTFTCQSADIDESILANELALTYVERVAKMKAQAIAKQLPSTSTTNNTVILSADTCVVYQQHILGKPQSLAHCYEMLRLLSNQTHQVYTCIVACDHIHSKHMTVTTEVDFKAISDHEIENYWYSKEPQDKAGAYGIQGLGGQFVKQIRGSYSAVVGLPLYETTELLSSFGIYSSLKKANNK